MKQLINVRANLQHATNLVVTMTVTTKFVKTAVTTSFVITAVTVNFVVTVIVTTKLVVTPKMAVTFIICFIFANTGETKISKKSKQVSHG